MGNILNLFSENEAVQSISGVFSSFSVLFSLLGAVLMLVIAFYGHKIFNIVMAVTGAVIGGGLGLIIGSNVSLPIGIVAALIAGTLLAVILYNSAGLFALVGMVLGGFGTLAVGYMLMQSWGLTDLPEGDSTGAIAGLILLGVSVLVGLLVGLLIAFMYSGSIYLLTSFGGAIAAMNLLLGLIPLPFMGVIATVLGVILGVFCFLYQLTGFKIRLKDIDWRTLIGRPEKKKKKKKGSEEAIEVAEAKAEKSEATPQPDPSSDTPQE
ncbi:MAG: hypothetical protein IJY42_00815 [Clostridia bacterium]|nr:hypothetical protein [Clostridia bacterium]